MNIVVKNCNNIDSAETNIIEGKLNIKFAPNGTGKSTIANAMINANDRIKLHELLPFKYRKDNPDDIYPSVEGMEHVSSIMCFNEDYVNQFIFKQNELVSNSFDIFIKNETFKKLESEIDELGAVHIHFSHIIVATKAIMAS